MTHPARLALATLLLGCGDEASPECVVDPNPATPTCATHPALCGLRTTADVRQPDPARAVSVVFVPEGFTAGELGAFHEHVHTLLTALDGDRGTILGREPARFNRYVVDLASPSDAVTNRSPLDTPLHGCLMADALHTPLPMLSAQPELALLAARSAVEAPDVVVVVLNTRAGRANAPRSVEPLSPTGMVLLNLANEPLVLDHELGHALVHLGDEYTDADGCFLSNQTGASVVSSAGDWNNGLEFTANLSVDPTGARWRSFVSGAIEGGARYPRCVYHPTSHCRMNDDDRAPFCPVCNAAIDRTLRRFRDGVDETPPACGMYLAASQGDRFAVCPRAVARVGVAHFIMRGPGDALLLEGDFQPRPADTTPSLMLGRGCATVDASAWPEGAARLTIQCVNAWGASATNTLTLDVRHAP